MSKFARNMLVKNWISWEEQFKHLPNVHLLFVAWNIIIKLFSPFIRTSLVCLFEIVLFIRNNLIVYKVRENSEFLVLELVTGFSEYKMINRCNKLECSNIQAMIFVLFATYSAKNSVRRHVYILGNQLGVWILAIP